MPEIVRDRLKTPYTFTYFYLPEFRTPLERSNRHDYCISSVENQPETSFYHLSGCGSGIELQVPTSEQCIYCNYRARSVRPYSVVVISV